MFAFYDTAACILYYIVNFVIVLLITWSMLAIMHDALHVCYNIASYTDIYYYRVDNKIVTVLTLLFQVHNTVVQQSVSVYPQLLMDQILPQP